MSHHLIHWIFLWWQQSPRGRNIHTYIAQHAGNGCGAIHSGNWTC